MFTFLADVVKGERCYPWAHRWDRRSISGGNGSRSLWRCRKCPVVKAKGS